MQAAAQDTLTMSINRNVGMALGNLIQGTFTLHGSGPSNIQNLTVYFNGDQVHFIAGNTVTWQFDTANYPSGSTNITLYGLDDVGVTYVTSQEVFFIGGIVSTLLTLGIIALVVVAILVKYGPRLMDMRKK
jgi:hypothetical protein